MSARPLADTVTAPIPVGAAVRFVERHHRRLPHAHHRMWAVGLWRGAELRGVALVGAPTARRLACTAEVGAEWPAPYRRLEVVRVAVVEDTPNGCSTLYGAVARAARAMGCVDLVTYTAEDEPGVSLRAAGWLRDPGLYGGGEASRPSRPRVSRPAAETCRRHRWWAPWSESAVQR